MYRAIVNGQIVTEEEIITGSIVYTSEGKTCEIFKQDEEIPYQIDEIIDAENNYVVPGGIDSHVHLGGFGTIPIADDFYSGSRAALAGGTTTVVDFCEPVPGEPVLASVKKRKKEAEKSCVDYAFHYTFTENYREELKHLEEIEAEGIGTYKVYTYYDNTTLKPGDLRYIMQKIKGRGTLLVHAEEKSIIDNLREEFTETDGDILPLALTRPNVSEKIATMDVLELAMEAAIPICIAHTSTKEVVDIKSAMSEEQGFLLETCPHYLHYTEEKLKGKDGALFTMNPPLRKAADNQRLWDGIRDGELSIFSTDHCPYLKKYKYGNSYIDVPCGVDGIQTRMWYLLSEGVIKRKIDIKRYVELTSTNAAKFYHLYPRKGVIRPGSDADYVIITLNGEHVYNKEDIVGNTDYSIFEGNTFFGAVKKVIKSGILVAEDGKIVENQVHGTYLSTN